MDELKEQVKALFFLADSLLVHGVVGTRQLLQIAESKKDLSEVLNTVQRKVLIAQKGQLALERQPNSLRANIWSEDIIKGLLDGKEQQYKTFEIPKKNGTSRQIIAPKGYLKAIQRDIALVLNLFRPLADNWDCSYGFEPGKSIQQNAEKHIGKKAVLNLDLQDFFPSVKAEAVMQILLSPPLTLKLEVAMVIAQLVTYKGFLPQGAPTSPVVSNFVAQKLDMALGRWAVEKGLTYTRYADDLTFSGNDISKEDTKEVINIIERHDFKHHPQKLRMVTPNKKQVVTGLIVNEKINVNRVYTKELRAILHCWKTKGGQAALKQYVSKYPESKWLIKTPKGSSILPLDVALKNFWNILKGKIDFVGHTTQWEGTAYKSLVKELYLVY